jgi:hypothetical protein
VHRPDRVDWQTEIDESVRDAPEWDLIANGESEPSATERVRGA